MTVRSIKTLCRPVAQSDIYPQRGEHIYQQISNFKVRTVWPLFRMVAPKNTPLHIFDMGLIMCSYGHNSERLAASFAALSWILKSRPFPGLYFVEAAKEGEAYEFEEYFKDKQRVIYIKKVIPPEADGLWLKEGLWTIGANYALDSNKKLTKLCFVDSDVEFVDQMWAAEVSNALNTKDAISPHSHFYYEGTPEVKDFGLMPSTGRAMTTSFKGTNSPGMAFACTAQFFKDKLKSKINGVASGGGDTYLWYQILGLKTINYDRGRLPYHLPFPYDKGVVPPAKIGDAAQIAVHRFHGSVTNRLYYQRRVLLKLAIDIPFSEYAYNAESMPIWSNTPGGRILSRAMPEVYIRSTSTPLPVIDTLKLYETEAIKEYGAINEEYPLVVVCVLPDETENTVEKVVVLKNQFANKCKVAHRFVCITNKQIPNVETIPLLSNDNGHFASAQIFGALNVNTKTSVLYCDLNTVLYNDITPHRCPENNLSMLRAREVTTPIDWGSWCAHVIYYRGDLSALTTNFLSIKDLDYQYIDVSNMLTELAVKNGIYPTSIEQHFCTRFYCNTTYPETQLMVFYNKNPELVVKDWIPNYNINIYA